MEDIRMVDIHIGEKSGGVIGFSIIPGWKMNNHRDAEVLATDGFDRVVFSRLCDEECLQISRHTAWGGRRLGSGKSLTLRGWTISILYQRVAGDGGDDHESAEDGPIGGL